MDDADLLQGITTELSNMSVLIRSGVSTALFQLEAVRRNVYYLSDSPASNIVNGLNSVVSRAGNLLGMLDNELRLIDVEVARLVAQGVDDIEREQERLKSEQS
jgi:hypothetical protein